MICTCAGVHTDVRAQSILTSKKKTEQNAKYNPTKKKGARGKKKKNRLQKSYFKRKSKQSQYPGNISIDPRPKDFTAIKERVEKRPSRKGLKTAKSRRSLMRSSSNQMQKSFGSEPMLIQKPKLRYKYASKSMMSNKGNVRIKSPKSSFKKSSNQIQKHTGNVFLQPEATKRDFNEIKSRVEKNPGKTMAKRVNKQKSRARSNAALTQSYRGNISIKGLDYKKQTYKFYSKTQQKSSGNLKAGSVKSAEQRRNSNSATAANFNGSVVIPSRNYKRKRDAYMSKVVQNDKGTIRKPSKTPGPQYAANWRGDLPANDRRGSKQWKRYQSRQQSKYSGDILGSRSSGLKGDHSVTMNKGNITGYSRNQEKRYRQQSAKFVGNYSGNLREVSKNKRNQQLQGKSLNASSYEGDISAISKKRQDRFMKNGSKITGNYSGDIKAISKDKRNQMLQGKSLNSSTYQGNLAALSKKKQDRFMRQNANITGNYSGNIRGISKDKRSQELQGKSLNSSTYEGDIAVLSKKKQDKFMLKDSKITGNYSGNIRGLSPKQRKQALQGKSLNYAEYQGELIAKNHGKPITRAPKSSTEIASYQGNIKVTGYDLKEKQFEHMSQTAHNFSGNLKIKNQNARDRYYRNLSDRNQQLIGNYRTKTRLAKDIEEQIASARVQNYQGGPKISLISRLWLQLFDKEDKLQKSGEKPRKPKYDSREYKIWN